MPTSRHSSRLGSIGQLTLLLTGFLAFSAPCRAQTMPGGAACVAPQFEATLDGYTMAEIRVSTSAEEPQPLQVTLKYLADPKECKSDNPECEEPLRVLSLPARCQPLPGCSCAPENGDDQLTFCIEATKTGNVAVIGFDRPRVLKSAGFLGLTYVAPGGQDGDEACPQSQAGPADPRIKMFDKHKLAFDVGTTFTLNGDGSWGPNAEAAAGFRSRWYPWFLSDVTFRYSAIGEIDESADNESDGEAEPEPSNPADFNPLAAGGGVYDVNVGLVVNPLYRFAPRLGLALGGGFSSLAGTEGSALETRRRYYAAVHTEVDGWNSGRAGNTLAGASSWVQVGMSWDDLYEKVTITPATDSAPAVFGDESERYFIEGEIELPRIGTDWLRVVLRSYASIPRSGDGPSDVRVAALVSVDPRKWFGGVGKVAP